jgi:transcriptional antiterminator RfaH
MSWLVATASWNGETAARENLEDQGFCPYFPKFRERRVVRGRWTDVERPLFGRYFFIHFVDRWRSILGTRGVSGLFLCGDSPSKVRDEIIDEIRGREVKGYVPVTVETLRVGQAVRVGSGSFEGHLGIYQGMSNRDREIVLLSLLGRQCKVHLAAGSLVAA